MKPRYVEGPGGLIISTESGVALARVNTSELTASDSARLAALIIGALESQYIQLSGGSNGKNGHH